MWIDRFLGLSGGNYGVSGSEWYQQQAAMQSFHPNYCIHGGACPICREDRERLREAEKQRTEFAIQKKEAYKKRCAEYMLKFRNQTKKEE